MFAVLFAVGFWVALALGVLALTGLLAFACWWVWGGDGYTRRAVEVNRRWVQWGAPGRRLVR